MGVRHWLPLALAGALAACDAPTVPSEAPAYDPRLALGQGIDVIYHWPLGHTIKVYVSTKGAPAERDLRFAVERGAGAWKRAIRYREFDIALVSDPAQADVTVHFDTDSVVSVTSCAPPPTGAGGVTSACPDESGTTLQAIPLVGGGASNVKFDILISTNPARIPNTGVFYAIVAHELGHILGIGRHSSDPDDLMFGAPQVDVPSAADAQTLRYLLHQPAQLRP